MKKIILVLALTFVVGAGGVFAAVGNDVGSTQNNNAKPATTESSFDCGIDGCTKTGVHHHKNYDPDNCVNPDGPGAGSGQTAPEDSDFDCGIDGCNKSGVHYHKNYDPDNCINPDGPGAGNKSGNKNGKNTNKQSTNDQATQAAPSNSSFNCDIDGCTRTDVHYHKNYDPDNCTNPDGPGSGGGKGHGNGNGNGKNRNA